MINNVSNNIAVVALSGGMDSCVTAAIARQTSSLALIHINYGQRTESRELKAFHDIADYYNAQHRLVVNFSHLADIGGSSLTDKNMQVTKADLNNQEIPSSYVPFRNANILCACVSWAEIIGAEKVYIGAVHEDSSGYPDCRPEFFSAFQLAANMGTRPATRITIETPIIHLTKAQIIKNGIELDAPLHLTWSCYQNENEACGVCDSCALRLRGFEMAGIADPIKYAGS